MYIKYTMKSKIKLSKTILPVRVTKAFVDLCKFHSNKYPGGKTKDSAAHFLKEAAREKFIEIGVPEEYLKSII